MKVPEPLEDHKIFIYQTGKKKVGRPKVRSENPDKRYDWILKKWLHQKKNKYAQTIIEYAGLIHSELNNNKLVRLVDQNLDLFPKSIYI